MTDQTAEKQQDQQPEIDFLQAFFIEYDPLKNMLLTSFGQMDSTGKQYSGPLVLKAAAAKISNLREAIINNARGRILLINGGASLAATQNIIGAVFNIVSAVAIRDPKLHAEEGKEAYLVSVIVSTDRYHLGEVLQIDAPPPAPAK